MNDSINLMLCKQSVDRSIVTAVDLVERDIIPARNLLDALETCHVAVRHVVCNHNFISCLDEFDSYMTADIAGSAGNKYFLFHSFI